MLSDASSMKTLVKRDIISKEANIVRHKIISFNLLIKWKLFFTWLDASGMV